MSGASLTGFMNHHIDVCNHPFRDTLNNINILNMSINLYFLSCNVGYVHYEIHYPNGL